MSIELDENAFGFAEKNFDMVSKTIRVYEQLLDQAISSKHNRPINDPKNTPAIDVNSNDATNTKNACS